MTFTTAEVTITITQEATTPEVVLPTLEPGDNSFLVGSSGIFEFEPITCSTGCQVSHELEF
jgi:hypothetical protein